MLQAGASRLKAQALGSKLLALGLFHLDNLAAFIIAAFGAGTMR
jgi:hypothetical protein